VEKAGALESRLRLLLQNPGKILKGYIHPGMTVLDLGCGTGFFTLEIAKLLEKKGKVIAADVQKGMLDILIHKLGNIELQKQIQIHNNPENTLNLTEKVDFILAFYSFHEMKYIDSIANELQKTVKPGTKILISEQKFHVSKYTFNIIVQKMENIGFEICERPKIFLSRTVLMKIKSTNTQSGRRPVSR
jgi:ubiquinone/menaquinone biosynthesis C-methylase UbiE